MSGPQQAMRPPPALREFLDGPAEGQPWPPAEAGARLNRVTHHALTPDDLPPMIRRRPGAASGLAALLRSAA